MSSSRTKPEDPSLPSHEELVRREHKKQLAAKGKKDVSWWPVLIGVAAGIWAPALHHQLEDLAPWAVRLVFPFMELLGREEIGLSDELRKNLPQIMLFMQFPLEGLLTRLTLRQARMGRAVGQLVFLHLVASLILWIITAKAQ